VEKALFYYDGDMLNLTKTYTFNDKFITSSRSTNIFLEIFMRVL
jgi:hypothetical protein